MGGAWGETDDAQSKAALHAALDSGVNVIDTANIYSDAGTLGRSERIIGEVLAERKAAGKTERIFVFTKTGRQGASHEPDNYSYESLKENALASCKRLGVDRLDLLQLHCPLPSVLKDNAVFDALRKLKNDDKIIHEFGVSVETEEEALVAMAHEGCAAIQIILNVFRQKPLESVLTAAKKKGVLVLARVPLASGLLTGKVNKAFVDALPSSDHRVFNKLGESFDAGETWSGLGAVLDTAITASEKVKLIAGEWARRVGTAATGDGTAAAASASAASSASGSAPTMAQFALRWILDATGPESGVIVIPGVRNARQAEGNALAGSLPPLNAEELAAVRKVYDDLIKEHVHSKW
jgi:aryl-alcohol dehydrogenase-like predicted oxidoreductase